MLNFYDFIQIYAFTTNHHLKIGNVEIGIYLFKATIIFKINVFFWSRILRRGLKTNPFRPMIKSQISF